MVAAVYFVLCYFGSIFSAHLQDRFQVPLGEALTVLLPISLPPRRGWHWAAC